MLPIFFSAILTALLPMVTYFVAVDTKGWEEPFGVFATGIVMIGLINGRRLQSWLNYASAQVEGSRWSIAAGDREELARHTLHTLLDLPRPLPPLGGFRISSQEGLLIASLIEGEKPRSVVELGSGCSTIIIARQLHRNNGGRLVSVDHEEQYFDETRRMLVDYGVDDKVELRHAAITPNARGELWYDESAMNDLRDIDLLLIDGPPGKIAPMVRAGAVGFFAKRMRSGGLIVVDDANRPDEAMMVQQFCRAADAKVELVNHAEKGVALLRMP